ncbi:hypothetical protein VTN77DRAFT_6880 [Rasamsonia byssochlamydoides]|uniref:uncharacterized protein n=1 Tax=Rasamsonia byssochlamydoides TaxID=89139 RepID=UPI0037444CDF
MTELDVRLYAPLIRFDAVYVQHFKCNLGTVRHDYPVLNNWLKNIYWNLLACRGMTDFKHIQENYTKSHYDINPKAITPMGPFPDVEEGVETDIRKLRVGGVKLAAVVEYSKSLSLCRHLLDPSSVLCLAKSSSASVKFTGVRDLFRDNFWKVELEDGGG